MKIYDLIINHIIPLLYDFIKEAIIIPILLVIALAFKNRLFLIIRYIYSRTEKMIRKLFNQRRIFLFGRNEIQYEIYRLHKKGHNKKCILICGNGGTGKTTIARYMTMYPRLGKQVAIMDSGAIQNIKKVRRGSIIFFDYIYENKEKIINFYNDLKKNSHVTVILLEREFNSDNICNEIKPIKIINLNDDANKLSISDMEDVIYYNVTYDFDLKKKYYKKNTESFNKEKANKYAKIIKDRFDPQYYRPIFAVIISKLYKTNRAFEIEDFKNVDELYLEYWEMTLGKEKHKKAFKNFHDDEMAFITELVNDVKLIILFVSLSGLKISVRFNERKISNIQLYENDDSLKCEDLLEYIADKMKYLTKSNCAFFLQENVKVLNNIYFIEKHDYDLSIAWLFKSCLADPHLKKDILKLITIINNMEKSKYILTNMYSCLDRIGDETEEYFNYITTLLNEVKENNINLYEKIEVYINTISKAKDSQRQVYRDKFDALWDVIKKEELDIRKGYEQFILNIINKQEYCCEDIQEIKRQIEENDYPVSKVR